MFRSVFSRFSARSALQLGKSSSPALLNQACCRLPVMTKLPTNNLLGSIMHMSNLQSKGDQELFSFLTDEIASEKKTMKGTSSPNSIDGFKVTTDQSELTLTKTFNDETIEISLNVNHTVDAEGPELSEARSEEENEQPTEMRSKPNFEVDIRRGNQVLSFSCSYLREDASENQEDYNDSFLIDEIALYEGEWKEQVYAVAGDILDGYLYDLFMNLLEERGISNEFVDKLSDYCTHYEHQLYVNMLTRLQNFVGQK